MPKRVSHEVHQQQKARYHERARKFAINGWGSWSKGDIERVMKHEIPDSVLAKELGRSIQAVQMVRWRYKPQWEQVTQLEAEVGSLKTVTPIATFRQISGRVARNEERGESWITMIWRFLSRIWH